MINSNSLMCAQDFFNGRLFEPILYYDTCNVLLVSVYLYGFTSLQVQVFMS